MNRLLILSLLLVGTAGLGMGCETNRPTKFSSKETAMAVEIKASTNEIIQNETVTFSSHVQNTLGHDAQLRWESTGGKISRLNNDRVAQVTFDTPGTYTVTCILTSDGREVARDSSNVRVKPLQ